MKKKHRNRLISRLLAMCLSVVMMLSMGITALAEPITSTTTGNFDVIGFDTTPAPIVTAYQIITVNIDDTAGQPEYPMYTWAGPVADWLENNTTYQAYIDPDLGADAVADAFADGKVSAAEMTKFLEDLAAAIKANIANAFDSLVKKEVSASSGTASFTGMAMGEYLIIASGGVKIYQPTTVKLVPEYNDQKKEWNVGTAVVGGETVGSNVKGSAPQIEKSLIEINDDAASADHTTAVGDTVTFKLAADVPEYPEGAKNKTFIISDKVGTGLEYQSNTVKVYSDLECKIQITTGYTLKTGKDAAVPDKSKTQRTFVIEFEDSFFKSNPDLTKVYVTYDAKVTAGAFTGTTGGKLINDAFLGYSNDPYVDNSYREGTDRETLYTYAINLTKVKTNGEAITTDTATFKLESGGTPLYFTGSNGVYTHAAAGTPDATTDLMTSTADGTLKLQGLDEGTYTLTETNAPDGYVLPSGTITIMIKDADGSGVLDGRLDPGKGGENVEPLGGAEIYGRSTTDDGVDVKGTMISFKVVNKTAKEGLFNLPVTGGAGTVIFTMAGILLMGGAVALLVVVLRRKRS